MKKLILKYIAIIKNKLFQILTQNKLHSIHIFWFQMKYHKITL